VGYTGDIVSEKLISVGYYVNSFDNLFYKNNLFLLNHIHLPRYKFIYGDITNRSLIDKIILNCDAFAFLSGLVRGPLTKKYPTLSRTINDLGVKKSSII